MGEQLADLAVRLHEAPQDWQRFQVYADALEEHGDPRGELIQIMGKLDRLDELRGRVDELLRVHQEALLGPAARPGVAVTWRWGFFDELALEVPLEGDPEVASQILSHSSASMLRALVITPSEVVLRRMAEGERPADLGPLRAILERELNSGLRSLTVGSEHPDQPVSSLDAGVLAGIMDRCRSLEELVVRGALVPEGTLPATLRTLVLDYPELGEAEAQWLAESDVSSLETLRVAFPVGASWDSTRLHGVLDQMPGLRELSLAGCDCGSVVVQGVIDGKHPRLEKLALTDGSLDDIAADLMIRNPKPFQDLEEADFRGNPLPGQTHDVLASWAQVDSPPGAPQGPGLQLFCSFCGKSQLEVRRLIAGPSVYICDECIALCQDIIAEEVPEQP